jgi:hypothetical protein
MTSAQEEEDLVVLSCCLLHETSQVTMEKTGKFVNCEDGLTIPW